jgi:hypothetical protein
MAAVRRRLSTGRGRDQRVPTVRADDQTGPLHPLHPPATVCHHHTGDPAGVVSGESANVSGEVDLGPSPVCLVDQQRVEHGPPRRVQGVHPAGRADRDRHRIVAIVEHGPVNSRCAGGP